MSVQEVIQHIFMLAINDFQTKKDLLAFHNHLSLKVGKCYVEHRVFWFRIIICGLLYCQLVQSCYKNQQEGLCDITYIAHVCIAHVKEKKVI